MLITNILSFIVFPIVMLYQFQFEKREDVINITDTNALRGIAAMAVVFAHFYNSLVAVANIGIGKLWLYTGGIGVCLFFFLSGYGLNKAKSYENPTFISKRLRTVLLPFILVRIICYFINYSFKIENFRFFLGYIVGVYYPQWFISVIMIIYAGYYTCHRLFGKKWLNFSMLIYNVGIGILFYALGTEARWYNAHLMFSIGMFMADHNKSIMHFLKKVNWWLINLAFGSMFLFFSIVFTMNKNYVWSVPVKLLSGLFICMFFYNVLLRVRLNSCILQWIGSNSLLIYIIHSQILLMPWEKYNIPNDLFLPVGLMTTFTCVLVYNSIKKGLQKLW